jgi:hypothetical protein
MDKTFRGLERKRITYESTTRCKEPCLVAIRTLRSFPLYNLGQLLPFFLRFFVFLRLNKFTFSPHFNVRNKSILRPATVAAVFLGFLDKRCDVKVGHGCFLPHPYHLFLAPSSHSTLQLKTSVTEGFPAIHKTTNVRRVTRGPLVGCGNELLYIKFWLWRLW